MNDDVLTAPRPVNPGLKSPRVLVVGAGPVGLAMACELWRHGVAARVIDACPEPTKTSKALAVAARTLEVLTMMGTVQPFLRAGRKVHATNAYAGGKRIVHLAADELDSPYPFTLIHPQSETERVLTERLAELGGHVERGTKLVSLTQDVDSVRASLVHAEGREERVETAWLVGCDGSHSAVRHGLDLPFEGVAYEEPFVLADLTVDWALPDDEAHAFLGSDGVIAAIPLPRSKRWRLVADASIEQPTVTDFEHLLAARGAPKATLSEPGWMTPFRIHRRIVPKYRVGRVFLAGDAAHIHSPMGGQGMNTGIQDAFNLAWKLALVESGSGRAELLDSYEAERRPVGAMTLQETDTTTRIATLRNPLAQGIRNRLATLLTSLGAVQRRVADQASEIGVHYRKSPIVGESRSSLGQATVDRRVGESPMLADWAAFENAPRPGDRAPDVAIADAETLFTRLAPRGSTLLLFDGKASTVEGYANLASIARRVSEAWGRHVEPWIVIPRADLPPELTETRVLYDPHGALHRRYGAGSECLYLIRPDGYVGFRSQPARWEGLAGHFARIFV